MSLFGCFNKKEKVTLASWLNAQDDGKYVVVDNLINLDPKNLYYKKSTSILALGSKPEVQIKIDYFKHQPDLGLSFGDIKAQFDVAEKDMQIARDIYSDLSQRTTEKIGVGVISPAVYFLFYGAPSIDLRKASLQSVLDVLEDRNDRERNRIWIEIMSDSVYGQAFKDVIPNGYWYRQDNFHDAHKLVSLEFEWEPSMSSDTLMKAWTVNVASERSAEYLADAYRQALVWAQKNVDAPFHLEGEQAIHYEIDGMDPMAIRYSFPYFNEKINSDDPMFETKVKGYVTGIYQVDERKYKSIKSVIER